jgi:hypothetical protein
VLTCHASSAAVYFNDFSNGASSLDNFVIGNIAGSHSQYTVQVADDQLQISPGSPQPSGAYAAMNSVNFLSPYSSILCDNPGLVTWAFNVWNQNGTLNNAFSFAVASSAADARVYTSSSYVFEGGGMVGNRMALFRQIGAPGGSFTPIIDIPNPNGLGTWPQVGSFKITFDPTSSLWSLYGVMGEEATNPENVNTLLGTAVDSTLTTISLPYLSMSARTTGLASFDNISVTVAPEPSSISMSLTALVMLAVGAACRSRTRRSSEP